MIRLFVYGASGHGKVVAEAARCGGTYELVGFLDDDYERVGQTLMGVTVMRPEEVLPAVGAAVALGIGSNGARREVQRRLADMGVRVATVVHPSAVVSSGVELGEGSFVGPAAVLHVDARVGRGCIVNSGAVVEHDNVIGDWAHISPKVGLGGNVSVGEGAHVGIGATVLPGIQVGAWARIGAGAVVISPIPARVTAVGVPARVLESVGDGARNV